MTDYLAKIAAWTMGNKPGHPDGYHGPVLDSRFQSLRQWCELKECGHDSDCVNYEGPGYTVNRDLAMLLWCIFPIDGAYNAVLKVMGDKELHRLSLAKGGVFTEALAKAVCDWLEAEKKATT